MVGRALVALVLGAAPSAWAEEPEPGDVGAEPPAEPAPEAPSEPAPPPESLPEPTTEPPAPPKKMKPEVSTVFTEDFELRWWQIPDRLPGFEDLDVLDYVEGVNRVTGNVRAGRWSVFGQLDVVALMANSYFLDDVRYYERDLLQPGVVSVLVPGAYDPATHGSEGWDRFSRNTYLTLEKLRASYDTPAVSVALGDSYASFGRGLVLDLDRNTEIDLDTSLQGLKLVWRPKQWDVIALFGQLNRQQVFQDNPNLGLFGDRRHMVGGLRFERYAVGPANLGGHVVTYNFTTDEGWEAGFAEMGTTPDVVAGGGTVEIVGAGPTDWYLEVDGYGYPSGQVLEEDDPTAGYAAYLSGAAYAGPVTLLGEFKRYANAQRVNSLLAPELYQVAIGPTLEYERQITEDSSAALTSDDLWGGRLRADVAAIPGELTPYVSVAVFRDLDLGGLHFNRSPETIVHTLAGVELTKGRGSLLFNVGYRHDQRDDPEHGADRHVHGDLSGRIPLPKDVAIEVNAACEGYFWGTNAIQQADYVEAETGVTLAWKNLLAFTWFTDVSSNPLIDSTGNLSDLVYGAAELQIKPIPNLTIRAFYGAYKSGIRCSGGQCRVLPGFEGARVSLSGTF